MSDITIRKTSDIVCEFNSTVHSLLSNLSRKSRSDIELANLDRLKKRISLLKSTMGDAALIVESLPFFVEYSEKIISRDENFFNNMDIKAEYIKRKGRVDKQDEFVFALTDSIRSNYNKSSNAEKDIMYNSVKNLFECSLEYKIAT